MIIIDLNNVNRIINEHNLSSKVEKVFSNDIANDWDNKSKYVKYFGINNPITNEVLISIYNNMTIADIGCGTGKLISKIDKKVKDCNIIGIDISKDMIINSKKK